MSGKFDLARLAEHPLTADEAAHIFGEILSGLADDKDIEAFLIALSSRKPAISEFVGDAGPDEGHRRPAFGDRPVRHRR